MKAPTIKEATREQLYEYFQYINGDGFNSTWPQQQGDLIGEVFCEKELITDLIARMKVTAPVGFTILDSFLSMVVFGFQCGREFEYRQMVKAMRSGTGEANDNNA